MCVISKIPNYWFKFCFIFLAIIHIDGARTRSHWHPHPESESDPTKLRNLLEEELLNELLLEQEFEEEEDQLDEFGFEYVRESKDNFRIGCTGLVFRQRAYVNGESGAANKVLKSLFIKDLDGLREIHQLKYATAKYRNSSGSVLEKRVYLGDFPEQCFQPLFRIEMNNKDYDSDSDFCLRGPIGPPGKPGTPGPPGLPGRDGRPGKPGLPGKEGLPGKDGEAGESGEPGECGEDGEVGEVGDQGDMGEIGSPGRDGEDGKPGAPGMLF